MLKNLALALVASLGATTCLLASDLIAHKTDTPPTIDGNADDKAWANSKWLPLDKLILGEQPSSADFSGRYKLSWDKNRLYILAEITDDILFDQHADPKHFYWDDDCLEIFIDADASGGLHQFDYNAFAYHVALDNQVADIGPNNADGSTNVVLLNDHIESTWKRSGVTPNKIIWEVAVSIYGNDFDEKSPTDPIHLSADQTIGFMLAYCDNDGSKHRESFIGSHDIDPVDGDKNRGYIDASVFARLKLVE